LIYPYKIEIGNEDRFNSYTLSV